MTYIIPDNITVVNGLLCYNGKHIYLPEADLLAQQYGFSCAETMFNELEKGYRYANTPDGRLAKWQDINSARKAITTEESALRKQVISDQFPTHKVEGTENVELSDNWKLKATFKQTYEWEEDRDFSFNLLDSEAGKDLTELWVKLSDLPDSDTILKTLFKVKVEFNATAYKKLLPTVQEVINPYIVVKEASTSLELVAPKEVK